MALLASCWLIIESIVIPGGYLKWYYLSFYIHPILLFLCQLFLWFKLLQRWLFLLAFFLFRMITYVLGLYILVIRVLKNCILHFASSPKVNITRVQSDQMVIQEPKIIHSIPCIQNQAVIGSTSMSYYESHKLQIWNLEEETSYEDGWHIEETDAENADTGVGDCSGLNSDDSSGFSTSPPPANEAYMAMSLSPVSSSISSLTNAELNLGREESVAFSTDWDINQNLRSESLANTNSPSEQELIDKRPRQEVDGFFETYAERMKWFDVLCRDRLYGIDAILKDLERSRNLVSWEKTAKEKLIKSLRSDFELVYVAQSCLSWEALQHQYWKVKTAASSNSENKFFHKNVADGFQKFQVLLERFIEDEPYEGKQYMHYVHKRFSVKNLIQVPAVSGYMEDKDETMNGEAIQATDVLRSIENCIEVFWLFVGENCRKPIWKMGGNIYWTHPPVEDPRDLELLYELKKTLKKKELLVKRLKAKKKCWLKKSVKPLVIESEKYELLFTVIELKLVRKVLGIASISTSQLKWCKKKLDDIQFMEGKVHRSRPCYLFPSS